MKKNDDHIWKELLKRVHGIETAHVKIGVMEGAGDTEDGNFSMVDLAAVHEFGSPAAGIPQRSFIRSTFDQRRDELTRNLTSLGRDLLNDKLTLRIALERLGLWGANAVKRQITGKRVVPRLEDSEAGRRTIARKNSSTTLFNHGQLTNSITWVVVE